MKTNFEKVFGNPIIDLFVANMGSSVWVPELISKLAPSLNAIRRRLRYVDVPVKEADEFVEWVRYAVPGMMLEGNERSFEYVASSLDSDAPVLEIGSFCGLSTILLGHFLRKNGRSNKVFTCDKWVFEGQNLGESIGENSPVTHDMYQKFVRSSFIRNIQAFLPGSEPHTVEHFSDDFFEMWAANQECEDVFGRKACLGGEISFCFIDGNHQYDYAFRDFYNTDRFLVKGGYVLLDDSGDFTKWDVNRLAREILSNQCYELVGRNPNYLFRKIR